jgi:hypothetical protein
VRIFYLVLSLLSAAMAALFLAAIARYDFGMTCAAIRTDALSAAGLLFAAVVAGTLFKRR